MSNKTPPDPGAAPGAAPAGAPAEESAAVAAALARGQRTFMGVELAVAPGALVPREETELLGQTAVELLGRASARVAIDMGCGSGNLACALALALPGLRLHASDVSAECAELTRRNVERLGLAARVTVTQGDLFAPLAGLGLEGAVDAVVCNPPYISTGRLAKESQALLDLEPRAAFDGGPFGFAVHQRVIKDALPFLRQGGLLMFEVGLGQARQVVALVERAGAYREIETRDDREGRPRVVVARKTAA